MLYEWLITIDNNFEKTGTSEVENKDQVLKDLSNTLCLDHPNKVNIEIIIY